MHAAITGWWLRNEVRVLPVLGEKLSPSLTIVRCTYHGNSNRADKDDLWKNWQMMVEITAPHAAGILS